MRAGQRTIDDLLAGLLFLSDRIAGHIAGKNLDDFLADDLLEDAVTQCLVNVGRAAGGILELAPEFEQRHPQLNLAAAYRARHRLAHGFDSVDKHVVWRAAAYSVPDMAAAAKDVLLQRRGG